jgi:hypothetical protein
MQSVYQLAYWAQESPDEPVLIVFGFNSPVNWFQKMTGGAIKKVEEPLKQALNFIYLLLL